MFLPADYALIPLYGDGLTLDNRQILEIHLSLAKTLFILQTSLRGQPRQ